MGGHAGRQLRPGEKLHRQCHLPVADDPEQELAVVADVGAPQQVIPAGDGRVVEGVAGGGEEPGTWALARRGQLGAVDPARPPPSAPTMRPLTAGRI
jgi:hypothetical protein